MLKASCVATLMSSALWLMHNNIMWQRFCAVVMWYAGPSSLCTTAVSLLLLSWIKNGRYWQFWVLFFVFFFAQGQGLEMLVELKGKIAAVWLQTTTLFTHSQDWWPLWWQVWRTSAGLDTHRTMVEGKKVSTAVQRHILYIWNHDDVFVLGLFFLYWETATSHGKVTCPSHTCLLRLT